jgi:hypothetical protein
MRRVLGWGLLLPLVVLHPAFARPALTGTAVTHVADVGEHYPLFFVEKSHHPENITVVYTKLDAHCRVLPDRTHGFLPTLDFYWLLDDTHYKPMARRLKAGVRQRLQFTDAPGPQGDPTAFAVRTSDLARVQHDLPSPSVQIQTARHGERCMAAAYLTLGPSNGSVTIKVNAVSTQTEPLTLLKTLQAMANPDALQIYAVTVQGTTVVTGQPIVRTYYAAPSSTP